MVVVLLDCLFAYNHTLLLACNRVILLACLRAIALGTAEWLCATWLVPLRAIAACVLHAIRIALLCHCAQIVLSHLRHCAQWYSLLNCCIEYLLYCAQSINHAFAFAKILINCVAKKEKENKVE